MSCFFRRRVQTALADPALQQALDGNARRRREGRAAAFASLPDLAGRRARAHAIRADVIEHLDRYLDQFLTNAAASGMIIHRATDTGEAIAIILEILRARGAAAQADRPPLLAKSKSMVSEEIGLNHALEAAGVRVVETDLGEYIVQLRGERPAHIITPAVHLRRADVGRLFEQKLGLPFTEDIPALTAAARRALREVFLRADAGLSGVNFGVAESGALCLVTNEGNGRMVTTLPAVHIALMGLERLVPTYDDLALMLSLLPRSATGQKLSVYTQLIRGPRTADEPDGPRERHLVLLDNGRLRLRQSPLRDALLCIRCGACLNACPVFREIGGHAYVGRDDSPAPYPGPIGSVLSPGLCADGRYDALAQASSLCGACREACPVDIDLPGLLLKVRAGKSPQQRSQGQGLNIAVKTALRLFRHVAVRPALFRFAQRATGMVGGGWIRLPRWTGWGLSKDLPLPAARSFSDQWSVSSEQWSVFSDQWSVSGEQWSDGGSEAGSRIEGSQAGAPAAPSLAEQFSAELTALGGRVIRVTADRAAEQLIALLRERGVQRVQAWDEILSGYGDPLRAAGIEPVGGPDPTVPAGLTGGLAGVAETGTLVLASGPGRPLTASLLPVIHIALLPASALVATLNNALRLPAVRAASSVALITGPSRTADIEMTLTIGVHGPAELIVLLTE